MQTWSLRDAKESDIEGMKLIHATSFREILCCCYTQDEIEHMLSMHTWQVYSSLINDGGHCIVAEDNSTHSILAFGCIGKCSNDNFTTSCDFELGKFYVDPSMLRRGLGTELFLDLEKRIVSEGGHGIGVVSSSYAVPFYQAQGFVVTVEDGVTYYGKRPFACKLMEKLL